MSGLILTNAQGRWVEGECNGQWQVVTPDGEPLALLPADFTEKSVMSFIRFAREHELSGFNAGVEEGLRRRDNAYELRISVLRERLKSVENMNTYLAECMENHIDPQAPDLHEGK